MSVIIDNSEIFSNIDLSVATILLYSSGINLVVSVYLIIGLFKGCNFLVYSNNPVFSTNDSG